MRMRDLITLVESADIAAAEEALRAAEEAYEDARHNYIETGELVGISASDSDVTDAMLAMDAAADARDEAKERLVAARRGSFQVVNELAMDDGGSEGNQTVIVYDILWDVEPEEEASRPKRASTTLEKIEDAAAPWCEEDADLMDKIGCWLQDEYGGGLSNFAYRVV